MLEMYVGDVRNRVRSPLTMSLRGWQSVDPLMQEKNKVY